MPSSLNASTVDALYTSLLASLPADLQAAARALPHTLGLAPTPDASWSRALRGPALPGLPLYLAEGLPMALDSAVREATRAHLLGVVCALAWRRLEAGRVRATPALEAVLEAARQARDESLERLGGAGPRTVLTDVGQAEAEARAARAEERDLLGRRAPVDLERYERLMLRTQAAVLPASLALAASAGCNEARRRFVHQAVVGVAMACRVREDALGWEEDEARGGSWAVGLMRHTVGGQPPSHPAELRRRVQGSGVVVRLLERAREHFAEVKRAAGWLGARGLERWAADEERAANTLARTEARTPGQARQWEGRHLAAS